MPNREVIEKWVAALESGEYQQAKRTLYRAKAHPTEDYPEYSQLGYCCLGVLCDLAAKENVTPGAIINRSGEGEFEGHTAFLPPSVQNWAGIGQNPEVNYERAKYWDIDDDTVVYATIGMLSDLNDDHGMTFPEIAGIIRENFLADTDAGQPA